MTGKAPDTPNQGMMAEWARSMSEKRQQSSERGMTEREEFDAAVEKYRECYGVSHGGCGCTGNCLGHHLSKIRKKYDDDHEGEEYWLSDQLHGYLKKRPGDSGRTGAAIDADNYWSGVQ